MFDMSMSPEMGMRVTPALLNLAHLLALPTMSLQQAIREELSDNPALEEIEAQEDACPRCGSQIVDRVCLRCEIASASNDLSVDRSADDTDPLLFVAAPPNLVESLLMDLYATLPTSEHGIAMTLVGNLDDRGFLADDLDDIAQSLGVSRERVDNVLFRLRELGPPGIATRDTRECMLVQIDQLVDQEPEVVPAHARDVVENHLEDLGARRYKQIARELHVGVAEVAAIREFVHDRLWPYPAEAATSDVGAVSRTRYRTPDIAINYVKEDDKFVVEVLQSPRRLLRLNPLYQDLARQAASLEESERAHVQEYISRARVFLANLRQRESTLQRIGDAIVDRQREFLLYGVRHLVPMTRAEIAAELGLHESTVSRATTDKTTVLPDGTLLPISEFFVAARGVQDVLRELIDKEEKPLSDQDLAHLLSDRGYSVARRTVAKYRDQMKIPPSHLRQ